MNTIVAQNATATTLEDVKSFLEGQYVDAATLYRSTVIFAHRDTLNGKMMLAAESIAHITGEKYTEVIVRLDKVVQNAIYQKIKENSRTSDPSYPSVTSSGNIQAMVEESADVEDVQVIEEDAVEQETVASYLDDSDVHTEDNGNDWFFRRFHS